MALVLCGATLAAEAGVKPDELLPRIVNSSILSKSFGPLKSPGGTVPRQVVAQAFGDLVRDLFHPYPALVLAPLLGIADKRPYVAAATTCSGLYFWYNSGS